MFKDVPLNTKQSYIMAINPGGCKIYLPVDTNNIEELRVKRDELFKWLNDNYIEPPKTIA